MQKYSQKESCKREKTEREELGFYQRGFIGPGEYRAGPISTNVDRWRKEKELKLKNSSGKADKAARPNACNEDLYLPLTVTSPGKADKAAGPNARRRNPIVSSKGKYI